MKAEIKNITDLSEKDKISSTFNIEIEQHLLGHIFTNNNALNNVVEILKAEYFYHPLHQKLFQIIIDFSSKDLLITPLTIKNFLAAENSGDQEKTIEYVNKLLLNSSYIFNIKEYAKIICNLALKRQLIDVGSDIVTNAKDGGNTTNVVTLIEEAEQKLFNLASQDEYASDFQNISTSLNQALEAAERAISAGGFTGIPTQYSDLDKMIGGLQNSDLLILAGRPSMGKTALAINIALNSCQYYKKDKSEQKTVGFFSLEMSAEQLSGRMIAMTSTVNAKKFRNGNLSSEDFELIVKAHKELYELPFFIDDTPAQTISAIRTKARRLKRKNNLALLVIDYLQLIRGSSSKSNENRVQEVSEITQGLKAIAKELNIPVIALSQLSRAVEQREDKRPQLSDLRESGTIEQDSDLVCFIYREQYYTERKKPSEGHKDMEKWQQSMDAVLNKAEIMIAKNRHGPVGNIYLHFDPNTTKFSNLQTNNTY
ncbi:MAG: replicative DNA helicase [Rickettsiales bacterium]|jgi:replicative DNA helicase|nr:replicative DNA helicase [Rickettsiales bacterium]